MKVLLGVCGGIAAYKAAYLVRELIKQDHEVRVVMTTSAQEFITPMTLQVLSNNTVGATLFDPTYESEIGHIELARWPDVIMIAPATANTIAKSALGMADDLLSTILLATTAPVVWAPAMNTQMYRHPSVQHNMQLLQDRLHHTVITPDSGALACKEVGPGRLPDPEILLHALNRAVSPQHWSGKHVLITAGPTREHLDPARFISNPSSGRMGFALAAAAHQYGAQVTLVHGPVELTPPPGVHAVPITNAQQLHDAVWAYAEQADCIVKAAAVADWRPAQISEKKRTKTDMSENLALVRTQDVLRSLCDRFGPGQTQGPIVVGFAAESHDIEQRGIAKLARKNAHMLVANRIGGQASSFGSDSSSCSIIFHKDYDREIERLPHAPKPQLARRIMEVASSLQHI